MASFTDSVHGFNPYVKTLPVDAYTSVGMYKEQQLKEGISKVQSYVDSIAGLPIDKPSTREYVQNKLGEIRKGLGEGISGDFSDQRLVSQVGGAVSKISSDPVVINGIAGTAAIRAGAASIAEAKKSGKGYGVQNEAKFNDIASAWQSDGDPTTVFNGAYTPYVDVIGRAMELYAKQNPGQNLPEGAFRYNDKGVLEVNPVIMEGVSASRIQSVLDLVYQQPDVQQQLGIDGWYKYRGATQKDLGNYLTKSTNSTLDNINDVIKDLQIKLSTDANASASSITKQIEDLKVKAENIKKEYKESGDLLTKDPDGFKTKLAKDGITSSFINAYSTQVMKKSPLWDAKMDVAKYELDIAKEQTRIEEWERTFDYNKSKDEIELQIKMRAEKKAAGGDVEVVTTTGNISDQAGKLGEGTFQKLVQDSKDALAQGTMGLVFNTLNSSDIPQGSFNPVKQTPGGGYDFNVDPTGKTGYKSIKEASIEYRRVYTEARAQTMGGNPKPSLVAAFRDLDPKIRAARSYQETQAELSAKKAELVNQMKSGVEKSNPEFVDVYIVDKQMTGWQDAEKRLKQKYGEEWRLKMGISGAPKGWQGDITGVRNPIHLADYTEFKNKFDATLAPKFQEIEDAYKSKQMAFNPLVSTILANKPEEKENYRQLYKNLTNAITEGNYSSKGFREILEEDKRNEHKENIYGFYQDPLDKKYYITVGRGKGQPEKMEVTRDQFSTIPGAKLSNPFWERFGSDLSISGGSTTDVSINGKAGGINTAYRMDRASDSKYDVFYHIVNTGSGTWGMKMYIKDKTVKDENGKPKLIGPVNPGLSTTMDGVMTAISQLQSDILIEGIINQNK